jgi:hypothetical protein
MAMLSVRLDQTKQVHAKDVLSVATNTLKILMLIEKEMTKKKAVTRWQISILQSTSVSLINFYTDDISASAIIEKVDNVEASKVMPKP